MIASFSIKIKGIQASLAPGIHLFLLIINLSYNLCSSLGETHRPSLAVWHFLVFILFIKTLYKPALLSIRQYNLGRHYLHVNPQVKVPIRTEYFFEINALHYRQWGSPHTHLHHTRYQRKMATANLWRHSRGKSHPGVCGLGALTIWDSPISAFPPGGLTPWS